jgi:hypothetical protein
VRWGFNTYLALAVDDNGAYAVAHDQDSTRAQLNAAQACYGPNVKITLLFHTRTGDFKPDDLRMLREHMRRKRHWRAIRSVVFGILALGFAYGAVTDLKTGEYNPFGAILFATVFGLLALHQLDRFLKSRQAQPHPKATAK